MTHAGRMTHCDHCVGQVCDRCMARHDWVSPCGAVVCLHKGSLQVLRIGNSFLTETVCSYCSAVHTAHILYIAVPYVLPRQCFIKALWQTVQLSLLLQTRPQVHLLEVRHIRSNAHSLVACMGLPCSLRHDYLQGWHMPIRSQSLTSFLAALLLPRSISPRNHNRMHFPCCKWCNILGSR